MDNSCIREMAPPVADIENLHRELEQLFSVTRDRSHETKDKASDTTEGLCLVIRGK